MAETLLEQPAEAEHILELGGRQEGGCCPGKESLPVSSSLRSVHPALKSVHHEMMVTRRLS